MQSLDKPFQTLPLYKAYISSSHNINYQGTKVFFMNPLYKDRFSLSKKTASLMSKAGSISCMGNILEEKSKYDWLNN